ncbi:MAG: D-alanyl-D-alanine carboxypeptidase/D-alanyl-D-alanine-endopeptidase [Ignavibacteriae bacterium]|nr:D-alanyl-D-alanine carboxypeptidase/D-alanyl-D-alanine-endopeptidase [Ignavibacteriota bacterium]
MNPVQRLSRLAHILPAAALLLIITTEVSTQTRDEAAERLRAAVQRELASPLFTRALAAVEIVDMESGSVLFSRNTDLLLRPASNTKLFTTAAALLGLPRDFAFETAAYIDSSAGGGATLWIRASGDPLLRSEDIQKLADLIRSAGVTRLAALALDGSALDTLSYGPGWMWDDLPSVSAPVLSAFASNGGVRRLALAAPAKDGEPVSVTDVDPCVLGVIRSSARSGARDRFEIGGDPLGTTIVIHGTVQRGTTEHEDVADRQPEQTFVCRLRAALKRAGVELHDGGAVQRGMVPARASRVGAVTHRLDEAVAQCNVESDNLAAELLLKHVGAVKRGGAGSTAAGIEAGRALWAGMGVDTAAVRLVDGSGMSFYNLVSAASIGALLRGMYRSPQRDRYVASLAVMGTSGTLARRLVNAEGARHVRGKTGTVSGVSALSVYVLPPSGRPLSVVMLMQNFAGGHTPYRAVQDSIVLHCLAYAVRRSR